MEIFNYYLEESLTDSDDLVLSEDERVEIIRTRLKLELEKHRFSQENSGINYEGAFFPSDRQTRSMITSILLIDTDSSRTYNWKIPGSNNYFEVNKTQLKEISMLILQHVEDCFDREKNILQLINSVSTLEEISRLSIAYLWERI